MLEQTPAAYYPDGQSSSQDVIPGLERRMVTSSSAQLNVRRSMADQAAQGERRRPRQDRDHVRA